MSIESLNSLLFVVAWYDFQNHDLYVLRNFDNYVAAISQVVVDHRVEYGKIATEDADTEQRINDGPVPMAIRLRKEPSR
ncbi:MAG: hypothetical protein VX910_07365 [Candidatus Latescibacterota bacterium]|nr:hypothetical protein [Candidatus Latescibacterota bacterium]